MFDALVNAFRAPDIRRRLIFVLVMLLMSGGDYMDPMFGSTVGIIALIMGGVLVLIGSFWIKKIAKLDV